MKLLIVSILVVLILLVLRRIKKANGGRGLFSNRQKTPTTQESPINDSQPTQTISDKISDEVTNITTFVQLGGNVDWNPVDANILAYDVPDANNWTKTWIANLATGEKKCITCDSTAPTSLHIGNPAWHPSQKWLVVQGVEKSFYDRFPSKDEAYKARIMDVGVGIGNELWATTPDGSRFIKLTDVFAEKGYKGGVLHPHFTHNGSTLAWTQRNGTTSDVSGEDWSIKFADFIWDGNPDTNPHLGTIRTYQLPVSSKGLYEIHSFSKDGSFAIFTSNAESATKHGYDIYKLDMTTMQSTNLTQSPREWDEHAHLSPDESTIAWISSMGAGSSAQTLKTEIWFMNTDGTNKRRVTGFNDPSSTTFANDPFGTIPADLSWLPDGKKLAAYVIINKSAQTGFSMPGRIVILDIKKKE